jgi:hypothetical protein
MKIIISKNQYRLLRENVQIVDDIIDKMAIVKYDGLTNQEKDILKKYSEYLKSDKKDDFNYESPEDKEEKNYQKISQRLSHEPLSIDGKLKNNDKVSFISNSEPMEFDEFVEYESSIIWDDQEWDGYIGIDDFGNISEMDYGLILDDKNQTYVSLKNEMGSLWDELKMWIQEVVVPQL